MTRVSQLRPDGNDFESAVRDIILAEMVGAANAANMPQGFADGIKMEKKSDDEFEIYNDWGYDGRPLAAYFEYGTKDHWVEPRKPGGVLAWKGRGTHAKSIYYKGSGKGNSKGFFFSKGHYVSGIRSYMAMNNGFETGMRRMRDVMS